MADWKAVIGAVAPTLATALGGPLAGAAVGAISRAVLDRDDATASEVAEAVAAGSPEVLERLKTAEFEFKAKMKELGVDLERIHAEDRKSARDMQVAARSRMPAVLTVFVLIVWSLVTLYVFAEPLPEANRDIIMRALGILDAVLMASVYFWLGSSMGSLRKTEAMMGGRDGRVS